MTSEEFSERAKGMVRRYLYESQHTDVPIFAVWFTRTLQNYKVILATPTISMIYEVTYNRDKKEFYMDVYSKAYNVKEELKEETTNE